jgi:hypothetical protein
LRQAIKFGMNYYRKDGPIFHSSFSGSSQWKLKCGSALRIIGKITGTFSQPLEREKMSTRGEFCCYCTRVSRSYTDSGHGTYSSLPLLIGPNSKPGSFIGHRWSRWSWARCYSSHLNFLFGLTQFQWKTRPNLQPQILGNCLYLPRTNPMKLSFKK